MSDRCPTCKQYESLEIRMLEVMETHSEVRNLRSQVTELARSMAVLSQRLQDLEGHPAREEELEGRVMGLQAALGAYDDADAEAGSRLATLERKVEALRAAKDAWADGPARG